MLVYPRVLLQGVLITLQMTIAQIVYDNELSFGYTDEEIHDKVWRAITAFRHVTDRCFSS